MVAKVNIGMIGAFDTKGADYTFLREQLMRHDCMVVAINTGVFEANVPFTVDVECKELLSPSIRMEDLRSRLDKRPDAMHAIGTALKDKIEQLCKKFGLHGLIGMGGTNGTAIITGAMQLMPREMPKVCISTVAQHANWEYTKTANIILLDSCVDVGGLNSISRTKYATAALIVSSLAREFLNPRPLKNSEAPKRVIGISMFGNTTRCVNRCSQELQNYHFEIMPFHAVGTGGKNLEALVKDGTIRGGVLDITLQEIAAFIGKGLFSAGPDRLSAPAETKTPHVVIPGCVDMIMLGGLAEAQEKFPGRNFYPCTEKSTAMRTTKKENKQIGKFIAEKMNTAFLNRSPVAILIPKKSLSMFDQTMEKWQDPQANAALTKALFKYTHLDIPVKEVDAHINDESFADAAVQTMLMLIQGEKPIWKRPELPKNTKQTPLS